MKRFLENYLIIMIGICYAFLSLSLFGLIPVISFHLLLLFAGLLVKEKLEAVSEQGLIFYMSTPLQNFLTQQSIFNILCKLWFSQQISLTIKSLLIPFVVPVSKEEAFSLIQDVNPTFARFLRTEGIVNLFPSGIRSKVLPRPRNVRRDSASSTNTSEVDNPQVREVIVSGSKHDQPPLPTSHKPTGKFSMFQPLLQQILTHKISNFVQNISHRSIGVTFFIGAFFLGLQIMLSKRVRLWSTLGIKFITFLGSFGAIGLAFLALVAKLVKRNHHQIEDRHEKKHLDAHFVEKFDLFHPGFDTE